MTTVFVLFLNALHKQPLNDCTYFVKIGNGYFSLKVKRRFCGKYRLFPKKYILLKIENYIGSIGKLFIYFLV